VSGDFPGVQRHLDHLVRLGVTAVELLPVADFPGRRNWGYDGVLLFAPDAAYGRPEDLKGLIDACHERGLCAFLDVVYNHFGPDGNYLPTYAPNFFTERHKTPWGAAVNFDGPESRPVRDFYLQNALYWLEEYRFDGLRFDAVHAILDDSRPDIVTEIAETIRRTVTDRPIHLILENDKNQARYLGRDSDGQPLLHTAQWNDDMHHVLRVLTSGQHSGYYADYADRPAEHLGRALTEGFVYQGDPSAHRDGEIRGEPSGHLPPPSFISFIQNHDQVGNDGFGSRLSKLASPDAIRAAIATYLLIPQTPMLFQGEEWAASEPFCYFCDFENPELAEAVRNGRRAEFAKFPEFADPTMRERIPDPTADESYTMSILDWSALARSPHRDWLAFYRQLIALRAREIAPRLPGTRGRNGKYRIFGENALLVEWRLGDGSELTLLANYHDAVVERPSMAPTGKAVFSTPEGAAFDAMLPPHSVVFYLQTPTRP
jgi:maltooligosyltrehalose trehalohydrolase